MSNATLPAYGSCLCGGVRFCVSGPFTAAGYCWCTHCQKRTGTGSSVNARVATEHFEVLAGAELLRAYAPPGGRPKVFCHLCGSHLISGDLQTDAEVAVRLGAFDDPIDVTPTFHMFVRSAALWAPVPEDGLERHETRPGD